MKRQRHMTNAFHYEHSLESERRSSKSGWALRVLLRLVASKLILWNWRPDDVRREKCCPTNIYKLIADIVLECIQEVMMVREVSRVELFSCNLCWNPAIINKISYLVLFEFFTRYILKVVEYWTAIIQLSYTLTITTLVKCTQGTSNINLLSIPLHHKHYYYYVWR